MYCSTNSTMYCVSTCDKYDNYNANVRSDTKEHVFPAGSSIGMVYDDSDVMLSRVLADGERLSQDMMSKMSKSLSNSSGMLLFNPISCDREEIVQEKRVHLSPFSFLKVSPNKVLSSNDVGSGDRIDCLNGTEKVNSEFVRCESLGENEFLLENAYIAVRMSARGQIWSIMDKRVAPFREVIDCSAKDPAAGPAFGNMLMLYDDVPYFWDAWDVLPYHLQRGRCINNNNSAPHSSASDIHDTHSVEILSSESAVSVRITLTRWGDDPRTSLTQRITLNAYSTLLDFDTTVSWFESHKLLKVEFPVSVRSASVAYDIQFGVQYRPTHGNHLTGNQITTFSTNLSVYIHTYKQIN